MELKDFIDSAMHMNGKEVEDLHLTTSDLAVEGRRGAIVGGTGGLGRAIAHVLAAAGADLTVVGRTFRDEETSIRFIKADLQTVAECERVAQELPAKELDFLIFTTGILAGPEREISPDGIELDMQVSYVSRFIILHAIAESLGSSQEARPRVFIFGFPGVGNAGDYKDLNAENGYAQWRAHMNTVAANEALVLDVAARFPRLGVFGVNPGAIHTSDMRAKLFGGPDSLTYKLFEGAVKLTSPTPEHWAQMVTPAFFAPELENRSGLHLSKKGRPMYPSETMTQEVVAGFTKATEDLLARCKS
jgi:NAD(P)-dependent dehydrogenase (short-subunit alcohol dehydrogenase family)